jgi:K+-transporting ATPase c subunit
MSDTAAGLVPFGLLLAARAKTDRRIARNTGLPLDRVKQLIEANTSGAGIGVPGVTVLQLNLAVRAAAGGAH